MTGRSRKSFFVLVCLCLAMMLLFTGCGQDFEKVWNGTANSVDDAVNDSDNSDSGSDEESDNGPAVTLPPIQVELPDDVPTPTPNKPDIDLDSLPDMEGINTDFAQVYSEMFTERDLAGTYDESKIAVVEFNGDSVTTESKAVKVSGTKMLLSQEGTYLFRGKLNDGTVIVDAGDTAKIQIVLDGVDMTSSTSAPIYVKSANKVFVTLVSDTENYLANGGKFSQTDENTVDAVIFSKQDITVNGAGVLRIDSPAGHGIVSKDDLVIAGGSYVINAASRGLDANDSVRIANAFMTVQAGKDGIRAQNDEDATRGFVYINDGNYNISAGGDAISASASVQIDSGKLSVKSGVDAIADETAPSTRGIKTGGSLLIVDGEFGIDSLDDAVNAKDSIIIVDGTLTVKTGDDAFHADHNLYAVQADVTVLESREAFEALYVEIRGGKIELNSSDDGINVAGGIDDSNEQDSEQFASDGVLKISGGEININALGDGIDVKGEFSMSDGLLRISVSAKDGNSIFDYDKGGNISGGTFIASGSAVVAQLPEFESQGLLSITTGSREAKTEITVKNSVGEVIFSEKPTYDYEVFIVSSADVKVGDKYSVNVGADSATFTAK